MSEATPKKLSDFAPDERDAQYEAALRRGCEQHEALVTAAKENERLRADLRACALALREASRCRCSPRCLDCAENCRIVLDLPGVRAAMEGK